MLLQENEAITVIKGGGREGSALALLVIHFCGGLLVSGCRAGFANYQL